MSSSKDLSMRELSLEELGKVSSGFGFEELFGLGLFHTDPLDEARLNGKPRDRVPGDHRAPSYYYER